MCAHRTSKKLQETRLVCQSKHGYTTPFPVWAPKRWEEKSSPRKLPSASQTTTEEKPPHREVQSPAICGHREGGITHGWLRSNRQRCLICLFHVYSWRTLTEGYGSIRELSAGGLIVRISEPHSNETYWGCLMPLILMHASEMNKASSRGKNNNNKGMKRGRRNRGGALCAVLSLASAQLLQRCPPSTWVPTSVPHAQTPSTTNGRERFCFQTTPKNLQERAGRGSLGHARATSSSWGTRHGEAEPQVSTGIISCCFHYSVTQPSSQPLGFFNTISAHSLHPETVNSSGKENRRLQIILHNISSFYTLFHLLFGNQGPNFTTCFFSLNDPKSETKTNEETTPLATPRAR